MAKAKLVKTYQDVEVLYASNLDDLFDSVENFVNVIKFDGDNIQDEAIGTVQISDASIVTSKIADDAVLDVHISSYSVTSAKLSDLSISAANIVDGSVQKDNLVPVLFDSSTHVNTSTTSNSEITLASAVVTLTSGGPVLVLPTSDGNQSGFQFQGGASTAKLSQVKLYRDSTCIANYDICALCYSNPGEYRFHPSLFMTIDFPPSTGTVTYSLTVSAFSVIGGGVNTNRAFYNGQLKIKELRA